MYEQEKIKPYGQEGEKGKQVEQMFDNIAHTYDTLNHRLSWNIDKTWRHKAIGQLLPHPPKHILDMATGTGDLAIMAVQQLHPEQVVGVDISESMLHIARRKYQQERERNPRHAEDDTSILSFQREDCMALSFKDDSFDAVTAAFGIRNFQDLARGLNEIFRVLTPGGLLSMVELTSPVTFPMKQLFRIYSHTVLPIYGRFLSKDASAYHYLTASIEAFPQGEHMVTLLRQTGFKEASFKRLTFGICTMYFARK